MESPRLLYEDNHILIVEKPARWLSQGDKTGDQSIVDWVHLDLKTRHQKPGNVYVGLVHRLDRPVSGLMVIAKTSKAAKRLSAQFQHREIKKQYVCAVATSLVLPAQRLSHWISAKRVRGRVQVFDQPNSQTKNASLTLKPLGQTDGQLQLLAIQLETGRKHQIRAQLAHIGLPIVGDRRYGSQQWFADGQIALHAWSLAFTHPVQKTPCRWTSTIPQHWPIGAGKTPEPER